METKENYRQWLQSDNAEIRNLAFQAALINKTFSLEELVFGFPELTERNLAWVLKMHPEKLGDFITDVKRLKFIPVKVVTEIVGLLSFYLADSNINFDEAVSLVDAYEPSADEAGELVTCMLICMHRENRWQAIAMRKARKVNATIEKPLLAYLERFGCPKANHLVVLDVIVDTVDYSLKAKIVNVLLQKYGQNDEIVEVVISYLEEYWSGLPAFMFCLTGWLKNTSVPLLQRKKIIDCLFIVLTDKRPEMPHYLRQRFFEELDAWLLYDFDSGCQKLEAYLESFPGDRMKVLRLYDRVVRQYCGKEGWFGAAGRPMFEWEAKLVSLVLDDDRYAKAVRRHGSKEEQALFYAELLKGAASDNPEYSSKAQKFLAMMEETSYLTGSVTAFLPLLGDVLQKNRKLKAYVNSFVDLLLAREHPLNAVAVIDLKAVDDFCSRYELKAGNFYEKYAAPLTEMWEKQNEEERIIRFLKEQLSF